MRPAFYQPFGLQSVQQAADANLAHFQVVCDTHLGEAVLARQVQDHTQSPVLIAPPPYDVAEFVMPPWTKG